MGINILILGQLNMEAESKKQQTGLKSFFTSDKVRYTFYFDLSTENTPQKVEVHLEARTLTEDALLIAIDQLNVKLRKSGFQLLKEPSLYKTRLVGRNFKPKTDMPCLSLYQKICDLKISEIAVQIPDRDKAIKSTTSTQQANQQKQQVKVLIQAAKELEIEQKKQLDVAHNQQP